MMGENWDLYIQKTERWERKEVAQEKEREIKKEYTELISKIHPVDKVPQRIKEQLFSFIFFWPNWTHLAPMMIFCITT